MFIIDGKKGERVMMDESISITILENADGHLILKIDSPNEVKMVKGEEKNKKILKK